jgi:hypothetical protein
LCFGILREWPCFHDHRRYYRTYETLLASKNSPGPWLHEEKQIQHKMIVGGRNTDDDEKRYLKPICLVCAICEKSDRKAQCQLGESIMTEEDDNVTGGMKPTIKWKGPSFSVSKKSRTGEGSTNLFVYSFRNSLFTSRRIIIKCDD